MSAFVFALETGTRSKAPTSGKGAVELRPIDEIKAYKAERGDIAYVDLGGLDAAAARKAIQAIRKRCQESAWGVVDPEGSIEDVASLFHDGAADYIGKTLAADGVTKARVKAALAFHSCCRPGAECADEPVEVGASADDGDYTGKFPGWKALKAGKVYPFYFLFASVGGQTNLKTRLGEAGYATLRDRVRALLSQTLLEADAMLWMETDSSGLYLLPPSRASAEAAVRSLTRLLLSTPLVAYEKLGLPISVEFTFAMHRGKTEYAPPGKTGTIVSDAVNFIFHLGAKRAASACLSSSAEAAAIPAQLADLYVADGVFEGRKLVRSRRFGA